MRLAPNNMSQTQGGIVESYSPESICLICEVEQRGNDATIVHAVASSVYQGLTTEP
jgi:hypothetical protein